MKIVLCSLPSEPTFHKSNPESRGEGELPMPPKIAIVSLVKHMLKNGVDESEYDFYDIDMLLPEDIELHDYFVRVAPDIVGLSAVTSGAYTQVKRVSRIIRKASPNTWIVLGGNLAASANVILRKTDVDLCVVGDGEIAWSKLIKYYREYGNAINDSLREISGVSYVDVNGILIFNSFGEKLPPSELDYIPDFEILKKGLQGKEHLLSNYFRPAAGSGWFNHDPRASDPKRKKNIFVMWTSKGCVVRCTFCQRPTKGYRALQVNSLEADLRQIVDEYDIGCVMLADETFGADRAQAYEFAALMKKLDLLWGAGGRCDSVTRDDIKFYADNNCVGFKFGVESGSQKILNIMEKKFDVSDVEQAVKWCAEFKILSPLAIMLGMPGETNETVRETSKFIAKLAYDIGKDPFTVFGGDLFYAIPFPGTPLYEYGQQLGIIGTSVEEEEAYLESLFSAPTYKMSYINLNGTDVKDLLFWDLMVQILVRKEYASLLSESPEAVSDVVEQPSKTTVSNNPLSRNKRLSPFWAAVARRIKSRNFSMPCLPWISNFIWRTVVGKKRFLNVPEPILFSTLKLFLYVEYLFLRLCAIARNKAYYQYVSPTLSKGKKISDNYHESYPQKKLVSLRNIVITNRKSSEDVTEQNRIKLLNGL